MSKRNKETETLAEGMSMTDQVTTGKKAEAAPAEFSMTAKEFCEQLSEEDDRVEIIGAFYTEELQKGRIKDLRAAYRTRFEAFCKRPV